MMLAPPWQALDDTSGKLLAVKMIRTTSLGDFKEGDLLGAIALRHPNLVRCVSRC